MAKNGSTPHFNDMMAARGGMGMSGKSAARPAKAMPEPPKAKAMPMPMKPGKMPPPSSAC